MKENLTDIDTFSTTQCKVVHISLRSDVLCEGQLGRFMTMGQGVMSPRDRRKYQ